MKTQEQARDLIKRFGKHVNGFVGSSMLTNTEFTEAKMKNSKQIAKEVVAEILEILEDHNGHFNYQTEKYWKQVLIDIDEYEEEDCWFCEKCTSEALSKP